VSGGRVGVGEARRLVVHRAIVARGSRPYRVPLLHLFVVGRPVERHPGGIVSPSSGTGGDNGSVDFTLPAGLDDLAAEAAEVGRRAAASRDVPEDGWLIGESPDFARDLAERGWLGMTWPTEHGGGGRSPLERFVVYEQLIAAGAPIATIWFADRQIGPTLLTHGDDAQRKRFLPDIVAGTAKWCIGMSEPDAGSDVAGLRTRAEPDGTGGWIVSGTKVWTSGAATADWCYLVARTDPDAPKHRGLSELIVAMDSPGVEVRPVTDATGNDHFCEVIFDGVRVPGDLLVGEPNGAFRQIMGQMEHERGGIDRLVSNRRLYEDARAAADTSDARVRQELAALETGYRIGRLLVLREVLGQAPKGFSAVTKTYCTEFEQRVAAFCARVAGADALLWGRVARNVCYAPGYTIMGGTTQILRTIIAERLAGLPR
jgi:alkylation response protein AidB-like acyl-CoA dehydrogenase